SPLEVFTKTKSDHRDLRRTHVFGCPVFVLEAKLQDGHKIPKFNRRARMGQFLGFSDEHSTTVARVRNLSTNFVSPQYHVVFDDHFTSIHNDTRLSDTSVESIFNDLFGSCREWYGDDADGADGDDDPPLELPDEWLSEPEQRAKRERISQWRSQRDVVLEKRNAEFEKLNQEYSPPYPSPSSYPPSDSSYASDSDVDDDISASEGADDGFTPPEGAGPPISPSQPSEGARRSPTPAPFGPPSPDGAVDLRPRRRKKMRADGAPPRRSRRLKARATVGDEHAPPDDPPSLVHEPRRSRRLRRGGGSEYNSKTAGLRDGVRDGAYIVNGERIGDHPDFERCYTSLVTDRMRDDDYISRRRQQFSCTLANKQPPPRARLSRKKREYKIRVARDKLNDAAHAMNLHEWDVPTPEDLLNSDLARFIHFAAGESGYNGTIESLTSEWLHPLLLAAKTRKKFDPDNPNWMQAMNGPYAEEYWEAACVEMETLEKMDSWTVVDRTSDMNVLPSTWAFKCKRFPDGLIKKFKARFCARGDRQIEGVDFFETYAPVVMWTTIRLLLILECLLGLVSKQGDVTCAFLHAHLDDGEEVYLQMPRGFKQYSKNGREKVLKLKRCLYGLRQAPRSFWKYMVEKLEICGLKQSSLDPCLFIGPTCLVIVYVDDVLLWSTSIEHIYAVGTALRNEGVDLEEESDAAGYLGVKMTKCELTNQLLLTQEGLTDRIIEAVGLDSKSTARSTPALKAPLTKDLSGELASGAFNYPSVIGMLLYLAGHSRPDIAFAVSQVARFSFCPRQSHENAVKLLVRYLLGTRDKGLVLSPTPELNIDAYPDADFAGLYGYEDSSDPVCVRSRTGFVICVANCPVLWKSQLQSETATSTMQSEVIAMAACVRELVPIVDLVHEVGDAVGLESSRAPAMHIVIHEDNVGALTLAETLPPQFTPRSKHYAVKTHWFREQIVILGAKLHKCPTTEQLGDIFTKALPVATFEYLRKKLMGW
ncbi:MAG: hypothetical protein GWQ05_09390, partial [Verrucomicrobiaceae bacterium]|nr:hypothetical protein [Verrucomicrobiaceae bacterium]